MQKIPCWDQLQGIFKIFLRPIIVFGEEKIQDELSSLISLIWDEMLITKTPADKKIKQIYDHVLDAYTKESMGDSVIIF